MFDEPEVCRIDEALQINSFGCQSCQLQKYRLLKARQTDCDRFHTAILRSVVSGERPNLIHSPTAKACLQASDIDRSAALQP